MEAVGPTSHPPLMAVMHADLKKRDMRWLTSDNDFRAPACVCVCDVAVGARARSRDNRHATLECCQIKALLSYWLQHRRTIKTKRNIVISDMGRVL